MKKYLIWIVVAAALGVALAMLLTPARGGINEIGNDQLVKLQSQGMPLIDVRTAAEFAAGHLSGATNVSMDQLASTSQGWNKKQPVIVYCATGARSANAAAYLSGQGFTVYNLTKGIAAWTGEVVTEDASNPSAPTGVAPGKTSVKTDGKPVFIDFAGST